MSHENIGGLEKTRSYKFSVYKSLWLLHGHEYLWTNQELLSGDEEKF